MKTYIVINLSDTDKVLWSQVDQTSAQTARRNVANTQCILSYILVPSFISDETIKPALTLDHALALELLATPEWTPETPI
tara:strand:- start:4292 stop:4531 length:240 start_codon:yes stop_codon:yes gene_type:complete